MLRTVIERKGTREFLELLRVYCMIDDLGAAYDVRIVVGTVRRDT